MCDFKRFIHHSTLLVCALVFSSCGTQINTLKKLAAATTAVDGVPPSMTSLTITNGTPTNGSPLNLSWGIQVGTYTHYCILENSNDWTTCIWRTGALPATYFDAAPDGPLTLTAYLKNGYGLSTEVDSNGIVIDRTPPGLASATITNADPTNNPVFGLSYGAITNAPYTKYCILENNTVRTACAWQTGALPATYTVTATTGAKTLSVWIMDAAGNYSTLVLTNTVTLNLTLPTVTISNPAPGTYVTSGNMASFTVNGTCSENGRNVVISGTVSTTVVCTALAWTANLNLSAAGQGTVTVNVDHSDASGNNAITATRTFTKDTVVPTVAISTPIAGSIINIGNVSSFTVTGTCSENGRNVVITGDASATVTCTAGAWTSNLDFTAALQGSVTILVNHSDAAGNAAVQASRSFTKDTQAPTLTISAPAANSYVTAANVASFTVNGTCSENGQNVVITGNASATVACAGGTWTTNLDFTAAGQGTVSIAVNHSDAAGNAATTVNRSFIKDTGVPTVAFTSPAPGTYVKASNVAAFAVSGTCSENGQNVVISGAGSATVVCASGAFNATLDLSAAGQGAITLKADHSDVAGNPAVQASLALTKDTVLPTVAFANPAAGATINAVNMGTFAIDGTCSENGRTVTISGPVSATPTCGGGVWNVTLDLSGASDGPVVIYADTNDAAGNNAVQASRSFTKSTGIPTLTISTPAANSGVPLATAAAFHVTGTCSANGQPVVITGDASASPTCTAGAWAADLDFSAHIDGTVSITVNHNDGVGNNAITQNRNFIKDTVVPTVTIANPAANTYATSSTYTSFTVSGACSENGRVVSVSAGGGAVTASPTCTALAWTANLDLTPIADGAFTVTADHMDAAGNPAVQASRSFNKDVSNPTVAITAPAANAYAYQANAATFAVSGTCSEATRTVSVSAASGAITASPTCTGGHTWSTTLNANAELDFGLAPASANLIRLFHLNDANGSGSVVDWIGAYNGTPGAGVTLGGAGKLNKAASFSGSGANGYITAPLTGMPSGAAPRSFTMWINPTSLPSSNGSEFCMLGYGQISWHNGQVLCLTRTAGVQQIEYVGYTDDQFVNFTTPTGAWTFLAFTFDGTNSAISINGAAPTTENHSSWNTILSSGIKIGGSSWDTVSGFPGQIDEIGIWNVALSPAQIAAIYTAQAGTYFAEGTFAVTADHTDVAGNNATQDSRNFIKDTVAPIVLFTSPAAGSYVTSSNKTAFPISGTCTENGHTITISGAGSTTTACAAGAWSTTVDVSGAADGTITLTASQSDTAGNNAGTSRSFTKDATNPTVAITGPAVNSYINSGSVTSFAVSGTCSETGQSVVISGSASATVSCLAGTWNANLDFSAAGQGTVTIHADHSDAAGNAATQDSRNFIKDTVAPSIASITVTNTSPTNTTTYSLSYGAITGTYSDYCLLENTTVVGSCGWVTATVPASKVVSGTNNSKTISIYLRDAAGNVSGVQTSNSVVLDTTAPAVAITAPNGGETYTGASASVTWTLTDAVGVAATVSLDYSLDSGSSWTNIGAAISSTSPYTWTLPTNTNVSTALVRITAADTAGNTASDSSNAVFTINNAPPPAPTVVVSDPTTSSTVHTNQATDNLAITVDTGAVKWCVIEQDNAAAAPSAPLFNNACFVGTRPTTVALTGRTLRKIYVYTQNASAVVSATAGTATIDYPPASVISFTGPASIPQWGCSTAMLIQTKDSYGSLSTVTSLTSVALSGGTTFYSDPTCITSITSINVAASSNQSASFYFKSGTAGALSLVGTALTTPGTLSTSVDAVYQVSAGGGDQSSISYADDLSGTCAIVAGQAQCWGNPYNLGNSNYAVNGKVTPFAVPLNGPAAKATQISLGTEHGCAVVDGGAYCWGGNSMGELGDNKASGNYSADPIVPTGLGAGTGVRQISASTNMSQPFTCALVGDAVKCWGDNSSKQLGSGNTTNYQTPHAVLLMTSGVTAIATGANHACAIQNGGLWCWGEGGDYALGNNATGDKSTPISVPGFTSGVTAVAAHDMHTCAIMNGTPYCWGTSEEVPWSGDSANQFADGTIALPHLVKNPLAVAGLSGSTQISMSNFTACVVVAGALDCWGGTSVGQRGFGVLDNDPSVLPGSPTGLSSGVASVSSGPWHTCAVLTNNTIKCWGENKQGQLGNGIPTLAKVPIPFIDSVGTPTKIILDDTKNTLLNSNGKVGTWGRWNVYQFNDAPVEDQDGSTDAGMPFTDLSMDYGWDMFGIKNGGMKMWTGYDGVLLAVNGYYGDFPSGSGTTAVAGGDTFFCAIQNSNALCSGYNNYGELGLDPASVTERRYNNSGGTQHANTVLTGSVTAIAAGGGFACAIQSGAVKCWGLNDHGQLGNGSTTNTYVPQTPVAAGATAIALGYDYACAVVSGGLKCWGRNDNGSLGDGTNGTDRTSPVQTIAAASSVTAVAARSAHTCAVVNGGVKCWGFGQDGQIGDGLLTHHIAYTPTSVIGLPAGSGVTSVSVGARTSCAIAGSTVKCWGSSAYGGGLSDGNNMWQGNTQSSPTIVGGIAQLAITSGPATSTAGSCSTAFTVKTQNYAGTNTNVTGSALTVSLNGKGTGNFYSDSGCSTIATSISIGVGTNTGTFYYKAPSAQKIIPYVTAPGAILDGMAHSAL